MTWILIIWLRSYATNPQPRYMGEYKTKSQCEAVFEMLKKETSSGIWASPLNKYKCVEK